MVDVIPDLKKEERRSARRERILSTLVDLLGVRPSELDAFENHWVTWAKCTPASVRKSYEILQTIGLSDHQIRKNLTLLFVGTRGINGAAGFLRRIGLTNRQIAFSPQLLTIKTKRLRQNYRSLSKLGLTSEICQHSTLLYKDSHTLRTNFNHLRAKGLTESKILANPFLLASNSKTVDRHWEYLKTKGISDAKIMTNPHLLQLSIKTLNSNYQNLRRYFGQDQIGMYPTLLAISTTVIEANIAFLTWIGIDYSRFPILSLTRPQKKREKISWLIRLLLSARFCETNHGRAIAAIQKSVADKPMLLVYSIASLEDRGKALLERIKSLGTPSSHQYS